MAWKVYLIRNQRNEKGYVGVTSKPLMLKLNEHVEEAYPGRRNRTGTLYALHAAIQKYGKDAFSIELLEEGLSLEQALRRQTHFITKLGTFGGGRGKRGYNQTSSGEMPKERDYSAPAARGRATPVSGASRQVRVRKSEPASFPIAGFIIACALLIIAFLALAR